MNSTPIDVEQVDELLETPDLAGALESEQFKRFLDHVPIAVAVSELGDDERIVYANFEFERLTGIQATVLVNRYWDALCGNVVGEPAHIALVAAIVNERDQVGLFRLLPSEGEPQQVEVHSNIIEDDGGVPRYRLVALVSPRPPGNADRKDLEDRIREKDTLLLELQHRVKNNLQMITALIRMEARNTAPLEGEKFERLAGRIGSLALLYDALSLDGHGETVDLGIYLSQIATRLMASHGLDGVRLDLQVDAYPVSINVAMPTGLVVNELLTNALKHAFQGREGGTIKLHCLAEDGGCVLTVSDDGIGFPEGESWPRKGKLGSLIAQSLRENAGADLDVASQTGEGTTITITFAGAGLSEARD
jgi:two-component sensor histidine kinase